MELGWLWKCFPDEWGFSTFCGWEMSAIDVSSLFAAHKIVIKKVVKLFDYFIKITNFIFSIFL